MFPSSPDRATLTKLLATTLRTIRHRRGLTVKAAARAMGMSLRSYERFEAAESEIRLDRLFLFARVMNSDPLALIAGLYLASPRLAADCSDNKLMLIHAMALKRFNAEVGDAIEQLDAMTLITAYSRTYEGLAQLLEQRRAWAANWLSEAPPDAASPSQDPEDDEPD
ncbi:MAG: helix-turn-helix domain-containing protein [Phenylobacterium sp.]|uniref:helix-turn-helix domain-containing protein n=1 Tax=Phenylobacterium sp. TaxID=1871053 RepID=UPI0025D40D45|nr:helix-turn-helix transcriptional regulator [Phenylobacterium sp.]MBI1198943.1 helix-turn-helix domain-containing protein [Phenylobacterium sp.]